jgi:hypothetical protein
MYVSAYLLLKGAPWSSKNDNKSQMSKIHYMNYTSRTKYHSASFFISLVEVSTSHLLERKGKVSGEVVEKGGWYFIRASGVVFWSAAASG